MARQNTWTNQDGLIVGFGTHSVDNNVPAEDAGNGSVKVAKLLITGTALEDTVTVASLPPQSVRIKRGARITRAFLQVVTAFTSGGAATLDIGTFAADATADDADGIDAAVALTAIDAIGEMVSCDGALVGATVAAGATSNSDVIIAASYNTAAFTAGTAILTVEYVEPDFNKTIAA
jgi:hypothetical protein